MKHVLDAVACWIQRLDEVRDPDAVLLDVRRSVQPDSWSCGAQSALMILRFHGKGRSIRATIRALGTDDDGTSTKALLTLFRRRGLSPVIRARATIAHLRRAIDDESPCLVSLDDEAHWGVVYGVGPGKVYLADPSIRKSICVGLSIEAFRARWDRWAMIVRARGRRMRSSS